MITGTGYWRPGQGGVNFQVSLKEVRWLGRGQQVIRPPSLATSEQRAGMVSKQGEHHLGLSSEKQ